MTALLPNLIPQSGIVIETARLRLRALRNADLTDLVGLVRNWKVARWLSNLPCPYTEDDGREWIAHVRKAHETGQPRKFAIAFRETDQLIGGVDLDCCSGDGSEEAALGYWLGPPYWARGYGREAVAAVIHYGFNTLGLETIQAVTDPDNTASQKVLLACGLSKAADIDLVEPMRGNTRRALLFRICRRYTGKQFEAAPCWNGR